MGNFLSVPHKLHDEINELPGDILKIYLLFLRCVTFKKGASRVPVDGTEFFEYPYSKARKHGYPKSKTHFWRGVSYLIARGYVEITVKGHFCEYGSRKKSNLYRLLMF